MTPIHADDHSPGITITVRYRGQRDLYQLSGTISNAAAPSGHSLMLDRWQTELEHELARRVRELEAYWPALPASRDRFW